MSVSRWFQNLSRSYSRDSANLSNNNQVSPKPSESSKLNQSLTKLYPEEGLSEESGEEPNINVNSSRTNIRSVAMQPRHNYINPTNSLISSSQMFSPGTGNLIVNDILGEALIPGPGTSSNYLNTTSPVREDSLALLKKSFPDNESDPIYQPSTSSVVPSARKRLRDVRDEGDSLGNIRAASSPYTHEEDSTDTQDESQYRTKRPKFSVSAFGSPIYNKKDNDRTPEPSFSLFYPGKIMFGGASNYPSRRNKIIPKKHTLKPRVKVASNTTEESSDGGLSSAARRILNCIDKISTPLSNSKRMASVNSPRDVSFSSSPYEADFHKHRPALKNKISVSPAPPTSKLLTPSKVTTHSICGLMGLNRSKSSENSTVNQTSQNNASKVVASPSLKVSTVAPSINFGVPKSSSNNLSGSVSKTSSISFVQNTGIGRLSKRMTEPSRNVSSNSFVSPAITDQRSSCLKKDNHRNGELHSKTHKSSVQFVETRNALVENSCYTFANPRIESDSAADVANCTSFEFKFRDPLNVEDSMETNQGSSNSTGWGNKFLPPKGSWECGVCMVQNKDSEKCVACETPKPKPVLSNTPSVLSNASSVSSFGNCFQPPQGSWDCDVCLVQNKPEAASCIACQSSKPSKSQISNEPKSTLPSSNWGDKFKPDSNSWECNVCLIQNKAGSSSCVACQTSKPSSKPQSSVPASFQPSKEPASALPSFNWGDKFKPDPSTWECQVCLLQNKESSSKCAACESSKPQPKSVTSTQSAPAVTASISSGWGDAFKPAKGSWECAMCLVQNEGKFSVCAACQSPKPKDSKFSFGVPSEREMIKENLTPFSGHVAEMKKSPFKSAEAVSPPSKSIFGNEVKAGKDWDCDTCLVKNKSAVKKCVCCESPKPSQSRSSLVSEALTGNFKFGVQQKQLPPTSPTTVAFTFSPNAQPSTNKAPISMAPASNLPSFSFSKPINDLASTTPPVSTSFVQPSVSNSSSAQIPSTVSQGIGFSFPSITEIKKTSTATTTPSFSFPNVNQLQKTSTTSTTPSFSFPSVNQLKKTSDAPPKSSSPSISFPSIPDSFKPPASDASGAQKSVSFAFGSAATTEKSESKPVFQFSSPAVSVASTQPSKPLQFPKFGTDSTNLGNSTTSNSFDFNSAPKVNPSTFNFFSQDKPKPPAFSSFNASSDKGSDSGFKPSTLTTNFSFNQPNNNNNNNNKSSGGFTFGGQDKATSGLSFSFGSEAKSPVFQFGQNAAGVPPLKKVEPTPPSFMAAPQSNMFSATPATAGPQQQQRRVFKRALRRTNKP